MKTNILNRFLSVMMASLLFLGLFPSSSKVQAQAQVSAINNLVKAFNTPNKRLSTQQITALTKEVTEVAYGPQSGEKGLFRQVGPKAWQFRTGGRPYDKLAAECVESSRVSVTVLLSCDNNRYQLEINLQNLNIFQREGGRRIGNLTFAPNKPAIVRYVNYFPVISNKDLKNPFKPGEIEQIMQWIAKETSNSQIGFCYKNTKGRGVGKPLTTCPAGQERNGALCYPNCRPGFTGNGPVCWGKCPSGFSDIGAFCQKRGTYTRPGFGWKIGDPPLPQRGAFAKMTGRCEAKHGVGNCETKGAVVYPKCRSGFKQTAVNICAPTCPAGWADTGTGCTKPTFTRGSSPMKCAPGLEEQNGLCYQQCPSNLSDGNGPVCWQKCTGDQSFQCGVGCASDINACASAVSDMVFSPIFLVLGLVDMGISAKIKNAAVLAQKNATTALGATGGAAGIAKGGLTADTFRNSGKWTKLFNELKNLSALEKAGKVTDLVSLGADLSVIGQGAREEIEKWTSEYEEKFANNTSPAIEATLRRSFDYNTQRYIKRHYSVHHLGSILESDGWRIGKLVMSIAGTAVFVDPGFIATINAYTQPMCPQPGANPLPNVVPNRSVNQVSSTDGSPSVNQGTTAANNVAKGKTARQSSTAFGGNASHAVDGNTDGKWGSNSVTHTNAESQAWFEVDLGASYIIEEIKLHNRTDCCSDRLSSYRILVSEQPFAGNSGTVFASSNSFQNVNPRSFRGNAKGRFVRIHLNGNGYLSLAEVEVIGSPNAATGNTTTTSSMSGKTWKQIGGALKHVSVGSDGTTWGVNSADNIYRWTGSTWTNVPGKLKQISVGSASHVWGVNVADNIYRWTGSTWTNVPGKLKHVSVGSDGEVWGVNAADHIYRWTGSSWKDMGGRLKQISVGSANHIWGVNAADNIYQWTGTGWKNIPGKLKYVSVGGDGTVWGVNAANKIYRRTGNTWTNVPGDLKQISAGGSNQVWGVYIRNGGIYIRTF